MKILFDENVQGDNWSPMVSRLQADGHDVVCVVKEASLRNLKDHQLGKIAAEQQRLIVTRDKTDFQYENFKHQQTLPSGLMIVQLEHSTPEARAARVGDFVQQHGEALHNNSTVLEPYRERIKPMEQAYQEFQEKQTQEQQVQEQTQSQNNSMKL